jgi:zinc transport system permease protein
MAPEINRTTITAITMTATTITIMGRGAAVIPMDDFLIRALIAGFGVAVICGPLGAFVVWRRMAFFGSTLAHSALLGVALGYALHFDRTLGMFGVSLVLAAMLYFAEQRKTLATDTLLGVLAHTALAAGIVMVAFLDTLRTDLLSLLFGDILSVRAVDLYWIYGGGAVTLAALAVIWRPLLALTVHEEMAAVEGVNATLVRFVFMVLLAIVIAVSLKIVGLLLITSMLVIPAATARHLSKTPEQMAALAAIIGCVTVVAGLAESFVWDLPSGAAIVLTATAIFILVSLWPRRAAIRP